MHEERKVLDIFHFELDLQQRCILGVFFFLENIVQKKKSLFSIQTTTTTTKCIYQMLY